MEKLKQSKAKKIINKLKRLFKPIEILQTLLAITLIGLCLTAAQWQYHRGLDREANSKVIEENISKEPLGPYEFNQIDPVKDNLRKGLLRGHFDLEHQSLVRDRYSNGVYGFEVLQLFRSQDGNRYWVDRGWVKAGKDAKTPPVIPELSENEIDINVRIRSENLAPQIAGSFYATVTPKRISKLSTLQGVGAKDYYLDLLPSTEVSPLTTIDIPELSNGPHYAYAIQWLAFGLMIAFGRILLFRNPK